MRTRSFAFAAAAVLIAAGAIAVPSCGGADSAGGTAADGAPEVQPLFDGTPPPNDDAQPPAGDPCGDARGLAADAPWPLLGGCPKRAGNAKVAGPQNAVVKWSRPLPAGATSPAIDPGRLVWVGTSDGDLVVVSTDGTTQGVVHTTGAVKSSAAIAANGTAVVGGGDGTLYGIVRGAPLTDGGADADVDGEAGVPPPATIRWSLALAPTASSPVIGATGAIYVGTADGKLVAVSPDGATVTWRATTNDTFGSSPAIAADGTIYVGSTDHHLYAIDAAGNVKWSYDAGAEIHASPAVGGEETVYVGAIDGKLHAVTPDGKKKWVYAAGAAIAGTPAVTASTVYVGSADKSLHAVVLADGSKRWTYATLGAVATPAVGSDGTIYVGSADGHLYALTPGGNLFFAVNVKGGVSGAPAIADDSTLYLTTTSSLVAVGP